MARLARRMAVVTHAHPVGQDGAAVVAVAAGLALSAGADDPLDPGTFVADCLRYVDTAELRNAMAVVPGTLETGSPAEAAAATGTGIAAHEAVPAALSAFLHHPRDPLAAVRFAVAMGGDTDTVAAMAGSLSGAAAGATALPAGVLGRLEARPEIERLAAGLARRTHLLDTHGDNGATGQ